MVMGWSGGAWVGGRGSANKDRTRKTAWWQMFFNFAWLIVSFHFINPRARRRSMLVPPKNVPAVPQGGVDGMPPRMPQLGWSPWRAKGYAGRGLGADALILAGTAPVALWGGPITSLLAASRKNGNHQGGRRGGGEAGNPNWHLGEPVKLWTAPPLTSPGPGARPGVRHCLERGRLGGGGGGPVRRRHHHSSCLVTWSDLEVSRPSCQSGLSVCPQVPSHNSKFPVSTITHHSLQRIQL